MLATYVILFISYFKMYLFIWLCWVFIAVHGLPPVEVSGDYSLVVVCELLIEVASLVVELQL